MSINLKKIFVNTLAFTFFLTSKVYADCSCVITADNSSVLYNISNKSSGNGGFTFTINGDDAAEVYILKIIHNDSDNTPAAGDIDGTVNSYGSNGIASMAGANAESFNVPHSTRKHDKLLTFFAEGSRVTFD